MTDQLATRLGARPKRIAVLRALQLGDLLVSVPFFRALRRAYPAAQITLIGLPWAKEFVRRYSDYLDDFLSFPGYPGLPECEPRAEELPDFIQAARQRQFEVAVQLHGSGRITNRVIALLGARVTAGFHEAPSLRTDSKLFATYPSGHEIRRTLELLSFLDLPTDGDHLEFPPHAHDRREFLDLQRDCGLPPRYVCVHAGARYPSRRWSAERFAAIADGLSEDGYHIVLTGSRDEEPLVRAVSTAMSRPHSNLAGRTSLGAFAELVRHSRLLITNDTGASHVAVAVGTRSVVLVLGSDPERWAPLDRRSHAVVLEPIDCRPCDHRICPIGHPCSSLLSVERVLATARDQLSIDDAFSGSPDRIAGVPSQDQAPIAASTSSDFFARAGDLL